MLPRAQRLARHKDIVRTMKQGKRFTLPLFSALVKPTTYPSRLSIVVSKKTTKSAVGRNRIKRRIRSRVGDFLSHVLGFDIIIFPKNEVQNTKNNELSHAIQIFFQSLTS